MELLLWYRTERLLSAWLRREPPELKKEDGVAGDCRFGLAGLFGMAGDGNAAPAVAIREGFARELG